jgi:hypothetical protein
VEEGGGELAPETVIATRRDDCPVKGFGGGGIVALGQCGTRRIEVLGKHRSHVSHVHAMP